MSLGNLMAGALDPMSILQQLAGSGGNVIILNMGEQEAPEAPELPGMPEVEEPEEAAVPPAPVAEEMAPEEEGPTDIMGAAKAALLKGE